MSIVMPAHNEAPVITRGLQFVSGLEFGEAQVVVAANGCTDGTVDIIRSSPMAAGVHVIDLRRPSKVHALNAADLAVHGTFPRVYLDADVVVDAPTLRALRDVLLAHPEARVAAPRPRFLTEGRPWAVRAFYRVFEQLPYASAGLVGNGLYAVNAAGRARFGEFPDVVADDLLIQRLFSPEERITVEQHFDVETPRTLGALVAVRTRVARGNRELAATGDERLRPSTGGTVRSLVALVARRPSTAPAAVVYAGVTLVARSRAARTTDRWERDETTRTAPVAPGRVPVGALGFDPVTEDDVVDRVEAGLDAGHGGWIVTPNVDFVGQARDPGIAALYNAASIVSADGMPVVWASRLLGRPLPERVTGASLVWRFAELSARRGYRLFLLGAAPGVADEAARRFAERNPGLTDLSTYCPPRGFDQDPEEVAKVLKALTADPPDIVLVAIGAPRQERLIHDVLAPALPSTWFLGCGGSLTMAAGAVSRAPLWVQRYGLEWVHRLLKEPRRLARRYLLVDSPVAVRLLGGALLGRLTGRDRTMGP